MKVLSREMAQELGLLKNPYDNKVGFYSGRFLLEGFDEAEKRRELAEKMAKNDLERLLNLPNCIDKELELFEFVGGEI